MVDGEQFGLVSVYPNSKLQIKNCCTPDPDMFWVGNLPLWARNRVPPAQYGRWLCVEKIDISDVSNLLTIQDAHQCCSLYYIEQKNKEPASTSLTLRIPTLQDDNPRFTRQFFIACSNQLGSTGFQAIEVSTPSNVIPKKYITIAGFQLVDPYHDRQPPAQQPAATAPGIPTDNAVPAPSMAETFSPLKRRRTGQGDGRGCSLANQGNVQEIG